MIYMGGILIVPFLGHKIHFFKYKTRNVTKLRHPKFRSKLLKYLIQRLSIQQVNDNIRVFCYQLKEIRILFMLFNPIKDGYIQGCSRMVGAEMPPP